MIKFRNARYQLLTVRHNEKTGMSLLQSRFIRGVIFASIVIFLVIGFWRPGLLRGQQNAGHQLGGDVLNAYSGNTVECFIRGVEKFESLPSWRYAECDIRETKDHELVVFHDWDISSVPNTPKNQQALGGPVESQPICELTLVQIQDLELECGCRVPTLEEILETAIKLKLKKPLLLEFKYLHSDQGRMRLLNLALRYRDDHGVNIQFLAFVRNVSRCFPDSNRWLSRIKENDFRVYQVFRPKTEEYDLCNTW